MVTNIKVRASTTFVFSIRTKKVNSAKHHTNTSNAIAALYSLLVAPVAATSAAAVPGGACSTARSKVGSSSKAYEAQKTNKIPVIIIMKKVPNIHSEIVVSPSRNGPTKKNIPVRADSPSFEQPSPISTMAKVKEEMMKRKRHSGAALL